jgi:hypothetical protein
MSYPFERGSPCQPPTSNASTASHRAGWTIGDAAFRLDDGRIVWLVSGQNGENLIRAEGATAAEAWLAAVEQASTPD